MPVVAGADRVDPRGPTELAHADQVTCQAIANEKPEDIYVEADGELLGRLPITLSMVPDALTVLVPKDHPSLLKD